MERQTASSVKSALGAINESPIDVSVRGYTTRLAGTIADDAQRPSLIKAAYEVSGVREVIDSLDVAIAVPSVAAASRPVPPADPSFDPLTALSLEPSSQTTLTPNRRADGMPRIKVFGSILPPWRAPAVFRRPEPGTNPVIDTEPLAELSAIAEPSADTGSKPEEAAPQPTPEPPAGNGSEPEGAPQATSGPSAGTGKKAVRAPQPSLERPAGGAKKPVRETTGGPIDQAPAIDDELLSRFEALDTTQIAFRTDSHQLTTPSRRVLDDLAALLAQFYSTRLEIGGHTDALGAERSNLQLSQQRSNSVRDYLVAQGVSPFRLMSHGYGEGLPIASNGTAAGRAANRRIELQLR